MEAGVAALVSPEGQRDSGEIVDERNGMTVFGEVYGADVEPAGVAGFDSDVRELFGDVHRELGFGFFAAGGCGVAPGFGADGLAGTMDARDLGRPGSAIPHSVALDSFWWNGRCDAVPRDP